MNIGLSEDQLIDYVENKFKEITSSESFRQGIIEFGKTANGNKAEELLANLIVYFSKALLPVLIVQTVHRNNEELSKNLKEILHRQEDHS